MKSPRSAVYQNHQIMDQKSVTSQQEDNMNSLVDDVSSMKIESELMELNNEPASYHIDKSTNNQRSNDEHPRYSDGKPSVLSVLKSLHSRNPILRSVKKRPKSSGTVRR
jgi:hypothetical protein